MWEEVEEDVGTSYYHKQAVYEHRGIDAVHEVERKQLKEEKMITCSNQLTRMTSTSVAAGTRTGSSRLLVPDGVDAYYKRRFV